jgi:hypothetical protein
MKDQVTDSRHREMTTGGRIVRTVDHEHPEEDRRFWARKTPAERLDAVVFLSEQCYLAMGYSALPRLRKETHTIETDSDEASS